MIAPARDPFCLMRGLYGTPEPDVEALRRSLPHIGDGLQAQLQALHDAPSESACEQVARNLEGARQHVLRLADAIRREVAR